MIEIISLYLDQTATLREALRLHTEEGNWSEVQAIAHKMIPSFSMVGMKNVYKDLAVKIKDQAELLEKTEEIPGLVRELDDVLAQACEEMEEELRLLSTDTNNAKEKNPL